MKFKSGCKNNENKSKVGEKTQPEKNMKNLNLYPFFISVEVWPGFYFFSPQSDDGKKLTRTMMITINK